MNRLINRCKTDTKESDHSIEREDIFLYAIKYMGIERYLYG